MKAIVFTLGFDVTSVIAHLSETGLEGREHLIFVIPTTFSQRAESSQKTLESYITVLNTRGFKLTYQFLSVKDEAAKAVADIYEALVPYDEISIELSGGLRYLILATFLAAIVSEQRIKEVTTRLESDGKRIVIPLFTASKLTNPDAGMLQELKSMGPKNQRQLAISIGRKISSINRTLAKLEKMGFVNSLGSHPRIFQITPLGEVFLHNHMKVKTELGLKYHQDAENK